MRGGLHVGPTSAVRGSEAHGGRCGRREGTEAHWGGRALQPRLHEAPHVPHAVRLHVQHRALGPLHHCCALGRGLRAQVQHRASHGAEAAGQHGGELRGARAQEEALDEAPAGVARPGALQLEHGGAYSVARAVQQHSFQVGSRN